MSEGETKNRYKPCTTNICCLKGPNFPCAKLVSLPNNTGDNKEQTRIRQCLGTKRPNLNSLHKRRVNGIYKSIAEGIPIAFVPTIISLSDGDTRYDNISYCPNTGSGGGDGNVNEIYVGCPGVYLMEIDVSVAPPIMEGQAVIIFIQENDLFGSVVFSVTLLNEDGFFNDRNSSRIVLNVFQPTTYIISAIGTVRSIVPIPPYVGATLAGRFSAIKVTEPVGTTIGYARLGLEPGF